MNLTQQLEQCFANLTDKRINALLIEELAAVFKPLVIEKNAAILKQADVWNQAFLIEQGLVRLHFLRRDGKEFNKNFYSSGSLLCPITPVMWSEPSMFGITAVETTQLWVVNFSSFSQVLERHHLWDTLRLNLLTQVLTTKLQREHDLLALRGTQRYNKLNVQHPELFRRVPHYHLATFLGMTDVSLSRLRNKSKP